MIVGTTRKPVTFLFDYPIRGPGRRRCSSTTVPPNMKAMIDLIESIIEGEREHIENNIVLSVMDILDDAPRGGDHVVMGAHDAFRPARGAGGIDQRRQIDVDDPGENDLALGPGHHRAPIKRMGGA